MCTHFWSGSILLSHVYEIEQPYFAAGGWCCLGHSDAASICGPEGDLTWPQQEPSLPKELTQLALHLVPIFGRLSTQNPRPARPKEGTWVMAIFRQLTSCQIYSDPGRLFG